LIPYEFHSEAENELAESAVFYESRVRGLGESFTSEVERALTLIREHPDLGSSVGVNLRRLLVKRFPYEVIYRRELNRIFIIAIAHQHRRPGYWRFRK
jgi:plasmid stabilization system protein ParE